MSKFDVIVEAALERFRGTNFLVGDRVKLVDNYLSHDWFKKQPSLKIERIKEMIDSGDNIRVTAVKADRPAVADSGSFEVVDGFYVDIMREAAPGLFLPTQVFTFPQELLEHQDDGINLAGPTPDGQIRKDTSNIKPEELEGDSDELRKLQTHGDGDDLVNPKDNTNIETVPAAKSYTAKYIEG
jgi:hypothetical protein